MKTLPPFLWLTVVLSFLPACTRLYDQVDRLREQLKDSPHPTWDQSAASPELQIQSPQRVQAQRTIHLRYNRKTTSKATELSMPVQTPGTPPDEVPGSLPTEVVETHAKDRETSAEHLELSSRSDSDRGDRSHTAHIIATAEDTLKAVDRDSLDSRQLNDYDQVESFLRAARKALEENDLPAARSLATKASLLAGHLRAAASQ